jgi:hypothetical protein
VFKGFCACLVSAVAVLVLPVGASAHARCTVTGTPGPDVLHGTNAADVICGGGGDDVLVGGGGNDILIGGLGDDHLRAGVGDDLLLGGPGKDFLDGGTGNNELQGGAGENLCQDGAESRCSTGRTQAARGESSASSMPAPVPTSPSGSATPPPGTPPPPPPPPGLCEVVCRTPEGPAYEAPPPEAPTDTRPPTFSWLTMDRSVDLSWGGGNEFHVDAWDEHGIASVTVNVDGPDGEPWRSVDLRESNPFAWAGEADVPAGSPLGVYKVESVELIDSAGNELTVGPEILAEGPSETEFSAYEGDDTEPPTLEELTITPQVIEPSAGPVDVKISGHALDRQSGVKWMEVQFQLPGRQPPFEWITWASSVLAGGTQDDGTQVATLEMPAWAAPGTYNVVHVALMDFAGNISTLEAPELEARGFPTAIEAIGPGDTVAPEIVSVSMTPATIPAAGGTVETLVHVRDDHSGLGEFPHEGLCRMDLGFEWPVSRGIQETTGEVARLVSGTLLDGTWRIITNFPAGAPAGSYGLAYIGVRDLAGNGGPVHRAELEAGGFEAGFTKLP